MMDLENKKLELEELFENLEKEKKGLQERIGLIEEEKLRLQGEYRLLKALLTEELLAKQEAEKKEKKTDHLLLPP